MEETKEYSLRSLICRNLKIFDCMMNDHRNKDMEDSGMTGRQFEVLSYLVEHQNENVKQVMIEKDFRLSNPTVSGILKRLEQNGLICRNSEDRDKRCNRIVVTQKAQKALIQAGEKWKILESRLFEGISEEEEQIFDEILGKLCRNITKMRIEQEKE